jgi:hypothetical protein
MTFGFSARLPDLESTEPGKRAVFFGELCAAYPVVAKAVGLIRQSFKFKTYLLRIPIKTERSGSGKASIRLK